MSYIEKMKALQRGSKANEAYPMEESLQKAFTGETPAVMPQAPMDDSKLAEAAARNAEVQKRVMGSMIQDEQQKALAAKIAQDKAQVPFDQEAYRKRDAELQSLMNEFQPEDKFNKTKKLMGR
jgi:hypothetical protein